MRITKEILLKNAREYVSAQVRQNRRLVCIYLTGSLLTDEPLLGRTTDIDLFFIHEDEPLVEREVIPLSDEVHFDIAHISQSLFREPRLQRIDPWIAPFLYWNPMCLHDRQHWFEFTQAGVTAQFDRPDYVLERARTFADSARQLWFALKTGGQKSHTRQLLTYLKALEKAANSVASLSSIPMTERRFLLSFPRNAEAIGRPGLFAGLIDLFMPGNIDEETWQSWLVEWGKAMTEAGELEACPVKIRPCRKQYYLHGAQALRGDYAAAALWPILRTWGTAMLLLHDDNPLQAGWQLALSALGLNEEEIMGRIAALDAYLDVVEEALDIWAKKNGLTAAFA
jgi:hypothetical protein